MSNPDQFPPELGDLVRARLLDGGLVLGELLAVDPVIVRDAAGDEHLCCDGSEEPDHAPTRALAA